MEENEQDKSEAPTYFKLTRARRKGTVARGADLGFFAGLAALLVYLRVTGVSAGHLLLQTARRIFRMAAVAAGGPGAFSGAANLFLPVLRWIAMLAGCIFLAVLLLELLQTGFVFSAEPLKPDFNRLNPGRTLKRLFSLRLLIETAKNVLKLGVYAFLGFLVIRAALRAEPQVIMDASSLRASLTSTSFRLLAACSGAALLFAVLDQLIVRRQFLKNMRMSRRELRRETREREGEPRLKQRRKQLHRDFAKLSQSLRAVRKADVIITNPEHVAIALQYDPITMHAPIVVSAALNHLAARVKRIAFIYGIPVIEDRVLARGLYRALEIDKPIPEEFFRPVANIYNTLRRKGGDAERA